MLALGHKIVAPSAIIVYTDDIRTERIHLQSPVLGNLVTSQYLAGPRSFREGVRGLHDGESHSW
jgi:hypothetical protein